MSDDNAADAETTDGVHPSPDSITKLPDWCEVYKGMTDVEIDAVEMCIVRDPTTRRFPEMDDE